MRKNKHHLLSEAVFSRLITASLKGISQVILIENVMTGFLILIAITIFSYYLGIIALLSAIIGTLVGKLGAADEKIINEGLLGYNSVLTGMALASFLTGPYMWLVALIGSALAAIFTAAMMHFTKRTEVPILTFPFVILTWFILLASYKLNGVKLSSALIPQDLTHWELKTAGGVNLVDGVFHGIGQVFFLNNTVSGILIFLAVFWAGRKLGLYAVIGNAVAIIIAFLLGGERSLITLGLYGYNAILTILAVSAIFKSEHNRFSFLSGIISACLTVPITAGLSTYLLPYGLPALTMPFVLCSWLFLGARKVLQNL
ncbi:urea transporter [Bacillus paralicheniformis]|jgi:urea transporter|uniref:Eukaryotic-type low-affinity urea transporter n=2 Tax=Bacillus paralicheniformis TaxID=1648923 RepID=A0A6N2GWQ3_9BACI|nr:urea transporter [Bacillus paralicheniformis]KUL07641.1 urea transporter [Bacillus licheniformis LMG 7559]AGN36399.1 putative urea transporter [Bacillus paralicheniformis ATCC 9945a]AYQ16414.1 urea transporter [Bacillus paralicheniformis]KRT88047.1 urea transporter [Bacillus paralicheniformis]MBU8702345.1 urea transporter [Bacillus paralicheniformis]